jgi:nucleoside-diphosphate-sugar epimerase
VAGVSEIWSALTGRPPAATHAIVRKLYSNRLLSCEKAIRELGYRITPLEEGLRQTIQSIQQA